MSHLILMYKKRTNATKKNKISNYNHTILPPQQPKTLITSVSFAMMRGAASAGVVAVMLMMLVVLNQLESATANDSLSSNKSHCNIYRGSWVYDNAYPLYDSNSCPFIERQFNCKSNGRPDRDYLKYRWQPSGCNIPRL